MNDVIGSPGGLVVLRAFEASDLERTFRWHNDPELYATLGGTFHPVSREIEVEWLRRAATPSPESLNLAICVAATGEHIGNIYLRQIDQVARKGELHIFLGDVAQRGKGYGAAAVQLLVTHALNELGLRRIQLEVLADNAPAISVYVRSGFVREGILKAHVVKEGVAKDVLVMVYTATPPP